MLRTLAHDAVQLLAQVPEVSPDPNGLPGGAAIGRLANGVAFFALIACTVGVVLGGATWGISSAGNNPYTAANGKRAVVLSLLGALVVAASTALVKFFVNVGNGI